MADGRGSVGLRLEIRHLFPLVPLVLVALIAAHDIVDNSFLWHVRAGAEQLADGRVLTADPFSFTMAGAPWRTQSWLAELGYAVAGARWGLTWVRWMVFGAASTALALSGITLYRRSRSSIATAVWLLVLAWLAVPFTQPRPVILSYVLLAALVLAIDRDLEWTVVPILWVWSAVHGSWTIGIGLLVLEAIRRWSWRPALLAGLGTVATLATAHGLGTWEFLIRFAANRDALALLNEWKPPDFGAPMQAPYLLVIVGVLVAAVRGKLSMRELVVVVPFLLFGLTTRRAVYPAALVLVPYLAVVWQPELRNRRGGARFPVYVAAAVLLAAIVLPLALAQPRLDPERFPSPDLLARIGPELTPFHSDVVGGYLIYEGHLPVFIDDRAELYGAEMFRAYLEATRGRYQDLFAEYGIDAVIALEDWTLVDALERDGWVRTAEDGRFLVYER